MANEIENIHLSGELAPISQPLAPAPMPEILTDREINDYDFQQRQSQGQTIFGQPLPAGVSIEQAQQAYGQLAGVFQSDFATLGHNRGHIQKAINWFMAAITNPPQQQRPHHRYNLFEHKSDPIFQAFANYAHDNGFSAQMVQDCCWWVSEAGKRLAERGQEAPAQGRAGPISSSPDDLDDATYNRLYDYNEKMRYKTEAILNAKWGDAYTINRRMVDEYLAGLPLVEQQHFDKFLNNGLHALNDPTVILGLYKQAIGSNNLPSGAALADEIAEHERAMAGPNRRKWMMDERMGARYRELITLRDGR